MKLIFMLPVFDANETNFTEMDLCKICHGQNLQISLRLFTAIIDRNKMVLVILLQLYVRHVLKSSEVISFAFSWHFPLNHAALVSFNM